ncbi:hypothetical protein J7K99_03765 [bacterium]|nr:hypothetical protein [bacterium]
MNSLLLIGLLIITLGMAAMIILLWVKLSKVTSIAQRTQQEIERQEKSAERQIAEQKAKQETQPAPHERAIHLPKPSLAPDARLEGVSYTYNAIPGVMGAIIADRFGQPISVDSDLALDKVFISAHLVELYSIAKKEKLSIGRLKNAILMGEGSYWVISELVGIHLGLWFEKEVPTDSALELFEDFKFSVANSLKNYYTKIW